MDLHYKNDFSGLHTYAICAYKESEYLEECIRSIKAQTLTSSVMMVTATPNAFITELAERYDIPLHNKDGDPGIGSDWNFALSCAETPLVTIAHQDDIYEPGYTAALRSAYVKNRDLLMFFCNYGELRNGERVDSNTLLKIKRILLAPLKDGRFARSIFMRRRILSSGSPICCPAVTLNRKNLGTFAFSETMKCDLDWAAWETISKKPGSFYYDSNILMYHRIHEDSETSHLIVDNTRSVEDLQMFEKFWPAPIARAINRLYSLSQKSNG